MRLPLRLALAVLVVSSMSVVIGASAFSSTDADRQVSVRVVEDGDAYVGLVYDETVTVDPIETQPQEVVGTPGEGTPGVGDAGTVERREEDALKVTNRFAVEFTIRVVGDDSENPHLRYEDDDGDNTATLGAGEMESFDAVVRCKTAETDQERTVDVEITADGDDVSADITREVTVRCERLPDPTSSTG